MNLSIFPAHPMINRKFTISCDDEINPTAGIAIESVEPGVINLEITAYHAGSSDFLILSEQVGVKPASLHVTVMNSVGMDEPEIDTTLPITGIFDLNGRQLDKNANLSGRVVIMLTPEGARKVMLKCVEGTKKHDNETIELTLIT